MCSKLFEDRALSSLPVFTIRTLIPALRVPSPSASKAAKSQNGIAALGSSLWKSHALLSTKRGEWSFKGIYTEFHSCALKLHCLNCPMSLNASGNFPFQFCWCFFFPQSSDLCLCVWDKGCTGLHTFFHVPLLSSGTKVFRYPNSFNSCLWSLLLGWKFMYCSGGNS